MKLILTLSLLFILGCECKQEPRSAKATIEKKVKVIYVNGDSEILSIKFIPSENGPCELKLFSYRGSNSLESWCDCYVNGTYHHSLDFSVIASDVRRFEMIN
jgi:hypothetical protein